MIAKKSTLVILAGLVSSFCGGVFADHVAVGVRAGGEKKQPGEKCNTIWGGDAEVSIHVQ